MPSVLEQVSVSCGPYCTKQLAGDEHDRSAVEGYIAACCFQIQHFIYSERCANAGYYGGQPVDKMPQRRHYRTEDKQVFN
jgi:hypothetical protein